MNRLTMEAANAYASLRSSVLLGLTLLAAIAFSQLNATLFNNNLLSFLRNRKPAQGELYFSLKPVNIEHAGKTLPIGCHLITPRKFYTHHGIYLGGGEVVHYSGLSRSLRPGPIEVINLENFSNGKPLWVIQEPRHYSSDEIITRARSRIGETQYKILSNNCEHFCSWCVSGKSYSAQVNAYFHCPRYLLALISTLEPQLTA